MKTPEIVRFWDKARVGGDGCWEWTSAIDTRGYGLFKLSSQRRNVRAHRYSWQFFNGPIPGDLQVLHRCDNRKCVSPHHLFLGTQRDNMRDASAKGRARNGRELWTHCPQGHPFSGKNLYVHPATGKRRCRECMRVLDRKYYAAERAARN